MQISHAATGAAVGKFMPNPILAFLAGVLVHFVIDKIPHFWPPTKKGKMIQLWLDHGITYIVFALMLIFKIGTPEIQAGIAGSLAVDIVIIGIPWIFRGPVGKWHTNRQPHQTKLASLVTDALVTVIGILIVIYF